MLHHDNALARLWKAGFSAAGLPFPFPLAEDLEAILLRQGITPERAMIDYRVAFPDSAEARRRILRFLLGANLERLSNRRIGALFEPYRQGGSVEIATTYPHLVAQHEP